MAIFDVFDQESPGTFQQDCDQCVWSGVDHNTFQYMTSSDIVMHIIIILDAVQTDSHHFSDIIAWVCTPQNMLFNFCAFTGQEITVSISLTPFQPYNYCYDL